MSESEQLELERRYAALRKQTEDDECAMFKALAAKGVAEQKLEQSERQNAALRGMVRSLLDHADTSYCQRLGDEAEELLIVSMTDARRAIETRSVPIPPKVQEQINRGLEIGPAAACMHDHTCSCGLGPGVAHPIGRNGCCRAIVGAPTKLQSDFWEVDGSVITGFTLREQWGYHQHKCGCWSRPVVGGPSNSVEHSED